MIAKRKKKRVIDSFKRHPVRAYRSGKHQRRKYAILFAFSFLAFLSALLAGTAKLTAYRAAQQEYAHMLQGTDAPVAVAPTLPVQAQALPSSGPIPTPLPVPTFYSEHVASLRRENHQVVGEIHIPGTAVQYPIVQGDDNQYYARHTVLENRNESGSIFMDYYNTNDFSDFNTVIYGHNMADGSMFSTLREYRHKDFLIDHKYIEITQELQQLTGKVFSAYACREPFDFRGFALQSAQERNAFLKDIVNRSEIRTNASATAADRIFTLVTCTSGYTPGYWVVHAVIQESG